MIPAITATLTYHPSDIRGPGCRRQGEEDRRRNWQERRQQQERRSHHWDRREGDCDTLPREADRRSAPTGTAGKDRRNAFQNRRSGQDRRNHPVTTPCRVFVEPFCLKSACRNRSGSRNGRDSACNCALIRDVPRQRIGSRLDILA